MPITRSGLSYEDILVGKGEVPQSGDKVVIEYTGRLENGVKFDSSRDRGEPFTFPVGLGRVIEGLEDGISTMKVGGKRKLIIPPRLAYGTRGVPGLIPPGATLLFDVELVRIR
jgi:peptidylprolyl isomerase